MPKKKKQQRKPDKRLTLNQAVNLSHQAYDDLEAISLATAERALREQFGFGDKRLARFREKYIELFGEEGAKYAEDVRKIIKRRTT